MTTTPNKSTRLVKKLEPVFLMWKFYRYINALGVVYYGR